MGATVENAIKAMGVGGAVREKRRNVARSRSSFADPDGNTFVLHQLYQQRTRVLSYPAARS
jgi:hypothetical protein